MKLPFKEATNPRYLYVNAETNVVHLLMPIMSGTEIGLDNTCKSVYSLQEFFGLAGANVQKSALEELTRYQDALEWDIQYLGSEEKTKKDKEERLAQIKTYLTILHRVQKEKQIVEPLHRANPMYPAPVESLMQSKEANLHSIILRSKAEDVYLRTTAIAPVFSANHGRMVNGLLVNKESLLYETLSNNFSEVTFSSKSSKELLIERVALKCKNPEVTFEQIRETLSEEVEHELGVTLPFNQAQATILLKSEHMIETYEVNQSFLDEQLGVTKEKPASTEEYVRALIEYCAPKLFDSAICSPFNSVNTEEKLIIATEFFLAELNIACRTQGITLANLGQILESNFDLIKKVSQVVKRSLAKNISVEDELIAYANQHQTDFKLSKQIPKDSVFPVKERFKTHYALIKDSPHFDEFMLLSEQEGLFFAHQNCICTQFANVMNTGFFELEPPEKEFLEKAQKDFAAIKKIKNQIPHKNEHIKAEINLDLSKLDNNALQSMYEEIHNNQDKELKKTLLSQFKKERPDFNPQIDAKAFLQHVAYGEQNEAEALLKKDPEIAQELLKAQNISFTDYSGRTFTCTAYEYAYWARDSHMQRMLEKYIRQNEETRQFILKQVEAIEKPAGSNASPNFFINTEPNGLEYSTKTKQGEIIKHKEAHFSLKPLLDALQHHIEEYGKRPAAWEVLNKIWVEEVGRAQRDVPAHIAQEYCNPNKKFGCVSEDKSLLDASKPSNLKRQLKFYNFDTEKDDLWFAKESYSVDSGLGFSFAIGGAEGCSGWSDGESGLYLIDYDFAAVKAIDKERTSDLKQSLENLSSLLIVQPPQPQLAM